jgi:hypothetical protein
MIRQEDRKMIREGYYNESMKEWHKAGIFYLILLFILFFPVFWSGSTTLLFGSDIHEYYYFVEQFFKNSIRDGIFPWWNPYQFGGAPFFANPQIVPLYPFHIIFLFFPLSVSFSMFIILHLFIGLMGMYRLIRTYVDALSAWVGGVLFGLSGFFIARILSGHVGIIASSAWTPWIVLFWISWVSKKQLVFFLLSSCCLAMQLMAGYQSITIFTFEILTVASVVYCFTLRSLNPFFSLFVLGIFGIGLSAYQMLPVLEFLGLSIRTIPISFAWAEMGASTWNSLAMIVFPFIFGTPSAFTGPPVNFGEHASYLGSIGSAVGIVSVVLYVLSGIGMGIPSMKYRYPKNLMVMTGIAILVIVAGLVLALSTHMPIPIHKTLWTVIPFFRTLRIPSRQLFLVVFAGSILAGFGISFIKHRWVKGFLCLAITVELLITGRVFISTEFYPDSKIDQTLVSYLTPTTSLFRVAPNFGCWIEPKSALPFNAPMMKSIFSATGYDPMIYRPYYDFIDATNGSQESSILINDVQIPYFSLNSQALKYLNIKYILTPTYTADPLDGKATEQFLLVKEQAEKKYRVYENTSVYPRFYFVPTLTVFDSNDALVSAIRNQRIDFLHTAVVEKKDVEHVSFQPDCEKGVEGTVEVLAYTPNLIRLSVSTPCNAFLTSSEVMYPGWTATIDGKRSAIIMGNMAFRILAVPKGTHVIEFRFIQYSFYIGCIISFFVGTGILYFVFRDTFVSRKKP